MRKINKYDLGGGFDPSTFDPNAKLSPKGNLGININPTNLTNISTAPLKQVSSLPVNSGFNLGGLFNSQVAGTIGNMLSPFDKRSAGEQMGSSLLTTGASALGFNENPVTSLAGSVVNAVVPRAQNTELIGKGVSTAAGAIGMINPIAGLAATALGAALNSKAGNYKKAAQFDPTTAGASGFSGVMSDSNTAQEKSGQSYSIGMKLFGSGKVKRQNNFITNTNIETGRTQDLLSQSNNKMNASNQATWNTATRDSMKLKGLTGSNVNYGLVAKKGTKLNNLLEAKASIKLQKGGKLSKEQEFVDSILKQHKDLDWVQRLYDKNAPSIYLYNGERGTHLLSDDGKGYVFPTIIKGKDGKLYKLLEDEAYDYAKETNTGIQLDKDYGKWFASNGYKLGTNVNNDINPDTGIPFHNTYKGDTLPFPIPNSEKIDKTSLPDQLPMHKDGGNVNIIPNGALHKNKHNLDEVLPTEIIDEITNKGIPVISSDGDGGVIQHAEVEKEEVILYKELTNKLEKLYKDGSDESALEAGRILAKELIENTIDNTDLTSKLEYNEIQSKE